MQKFKNNWKDYLTILIIVIIVLIGIEILKTHTNYYWKGFNDLFVFNEKQSNEVKISTIQLIVAFFASIIALWSYISFNIKEKKLKEKEQNDFVKIYVEAINNNEFIKIKTKVENPVNTSKKIKFAFLIISKSDINFLDLIETHLQKDIQSTNNLKELFGFIDFTLDKLAYIPLPYYYKENIGVGNEKLTFSHLLNINNLEAGIYDVRFFVFSSEGHYHRSVQDVFYLSNIIKNGNNIIYPYFEPYKSKNAEIKKNT